MIDNLRRSLVAPSAWLLFFFALALFGEEAGPVLGLLAVLFLLPTVMTLVTDLWPRRSNTTLFQHFQYAYQEFETGLARVMMEIFLLPHHAWISMEAIGLALWRMSVSRKRLLEWTTAAHAKDAASLELRGFIHGMRISVLLTAVLVAIVFFQHPKVALFALPFFLLWLGAPILARLYSSPPEARVIHPVDIDDIEIFQATARRIWLFFATFVTEKENFLPPDNFQETPSPVVAHRSSPTNFGLYLLSVLSARDFGWIGTLETFERLDNTLKSLLKLERHAGHFYNWYETTECRPLEPKYISSVDNGNLTGHLVAVAQGCEEVLNSKLDFGAFESGVLNTLTILRHELQIYKSKYLEPSEGFSKVSEESERKEK